LTHYHYTPQAINAEVKIVRNLPTIAMEEVAPVAMSDATLLAPQEIVDKKKGDSIGMYQHAQSAHATICSVLTQPLATL
jgi:U3 small nucleolar RNA-associated protein MPP10